MNVFAASSLLTCTVSAFFGTIVLYRNPREASNHNLILPKPEPWVRKPLTMFAQQPEGSLKLDRNASTALEILLNQHSAVHDTQKDIATVIVYNGGPHEC
jgi:hypothetical protein